MKRSATALRSAASVPSSVLNLPPGSPPRKVKRRSVTLEYEGVVDTGTTNTITTEVDPTSPARGFGKPIEPHLGWAKQLENIKLMRASGGAPVDTMGCERCADPDALPEVQRFQTLVSLMLSSQTKDEITYAACKRLLGGVKGGFTAAGVAATPIPELETLIFPVGFYRNKAKFIQAAGKDCVEKYGGDIPRSVEELCKLKGVGPKMAFITMSSAWGRNVGIGVDTHVHRISNRLGWVATDSPQATQAHLQSWLPRVEWEPLNLLLVGFGQTVCTPLNPKCGECKVRQFCPVGVGKAKSVLAASEIK